MHSSLFFRLFPPPKYLSQPVVGLDISEQSIKFISLKPKGARLTIGSYGGLKIPTGLISDGRIIDKDGFQKILSDFRLRYGLGPVAVSLPEEQAFVVDMKLPSMKKSEIRESVELSLEEYVPLPVPETVFDYEILKHPENKKDHYVLGVSVLPKQMVESYLEVLLAAGFQPKVLEIEAQAQARALVSPQKSGELERVLIVDIGRLRAGFSVVVNGIVSFTSTVAHIGGEDITKSISKHLSVDTEEAEKLKIEKGLLRSAGTKDLFYSIIPVVSALADEIRRVIDYIHTHRGSEQKPNKIILTGGQATLLGLDTYLAANLGIEVVVGNTWERVLSFEDEIPEIDFNNSGRYATAVGLALINYD